MWKPSASIRTASAVSRSSWWCTNTSCVGPSYVCRWNSRTTSSTRRMEVPCIGSATMHDTFGIIPAQCDALSASGSRGAARPPAPAPRSFRCGAAAQPFTEDQCRSRPAGAALAPTSMAPGCSARKRRQSGRCRRAGSRQRLRCRAWASAVKFRSQAAFEAAFAAILLWRSSPSMAGCAARKAAHSGRSRRSGASQSLRCKASASAANECSQVLCSDAADAIAPCRPTTACAKST
mmetsp:Transcript_99073/g.277499  ORF Transcript_99073/g.277499 Transcript_99073/m.277499 type:complete len:235 (+) Transcript_99073:267-971(+)